LHQQHDDILAWFGVGPTALIGSGGQSLVYALDGDRVLRVLRGEGDVVALTRTKSFLAEIEGKLSVKTPRIEEIDAKGRYTIEPRQPGIAMTLMMAGLSGERRRTMLANYVESADAAAAIKFPDRPYGEVLAAAPIHAETWTDYLRRSTDRWLLKNNAAIAEAVGDTESLRAKALAFIDAVEARPEKALVHGDYFPGNVLIDRDLSVSAILDFSAFTVIGDPLYDVTCAPIFLEMIEQASEDDVATARQLVREQHGDAIEAAARAYRAHAAFAMADPANARPPYPRLYGWAIANLKRLAADDPPA